MMLIKNTWLQRSLSSYLSNLDVGHERLSTKITINRWVLETNK